MDIVLENFDTDLNRANITWYLDGKIQKEGIGERNFTFTTGSLGSASVIRAVIEPNDIATFSHQQTIRPSEVDIIWEAETYTPTFFKGKKLYSQESKLNILAIPQFINSSGNRIPSDNLIYTWKYNSNNLSRASGYGRDTLSLFGSLFEQRETVELTVESLDGQYITKKSIVIKAVNPEIIFYQNHPLYGLLLNRALPEQFNLEGDEITVSAEPYYFDGDASPGSSLQFSWTINNTPTRPLIEAPRALVLRREGGLTGIAQIGLSVSHLSKILQVASNNFHISFGQ